MREFTIDAAVCYDEADRPVVNGNIVAFMKKLELVHQQTWAEEALRAFDELVREDLPLALGASIGRVGIPYFRVALPLSLFKYAPAALDRLALDYLGHGALGSRREMALYIVYILVCIGALEPLALGLLAWTTRFFRD